MVWPISSGASWPGTSTGEFDNYVGLFKEAYSDMIRLKTQTTESVLSDTLLPENLQGDPLNLDTYKGVDLVQRDRGQQYGNDTTGGDKNYEMTGVERRTVLPQFWEFAELFDPRDERALMRAVRPDGQYAQNVIAAFNRKKDDVILDALLADATVNGTLLDSSSATTRRTNLHGFRKDTDMNYGRTAAQADALNAATADVVSGAGNNITGTLGALVEANSSVAGENGCQHIILGDLAPLSQQSRQVLDTAPAAGSEIFGTAAGTADPTLLTENASGLASTGFHMSKVLIGLQVLHTGGLPQGTKIHCVVSPADVVNMMHEAQYTSADYNALRPLQSGQPVDFLGVSFRVCNQITRGETVLTGFEGTTADTFDTSTGHYAYMYAEGAGVFGMTNDVTVRFDEIPQRGYSLQCYHNFGLGAARMDPKQMIIIPCSD